MRRQFGQLEVIMIITLLFAIPIIGTIAVDFYHVHATQKALQNAVDAAALAGAADLWFNLDNAAADAYKFAALNVVEGKTVSNSTPGTTVTVNVTPPQGNEPGTVEVIATRQVHHLLAPSFGRYVDTVTAHALAGTQGKLWRIAMDQMFPLAVSIDAVPTGGSALSTKSVGDAFTVYIEASGVKNGAYTSFTQSPCNANYVAAAISDALGIQNQPPGYIPSIAVGDTIQLNNGNFGMHMITSDPAYSALLNEPFIILPIIEGTPPLNQGAQVVGFLGLKVTAINKNSKDPNSVDSISGTIVAPQVIGESGPFPTNGSAIDNAVSRLDLGPIQLVQ